MNEEGDVPTVSEAVQSSPMESPNEELAPKTDKPQQELTDSRKTTQSTRLIRRLGSLTGITKSKAKVATESTEEVALQIKVSQLTKELEESRNEIDRCKRESGDVSERAKRESDEIRAEFDRYKLESQFEKKSLMTKMENDDKLKTAEMEMLKISHLKTEAEKDSLISKMECEVKLKSSEIDNLKIANLKTEAEMETLITRMECDAKLKSAEIDNLKRELEDASASAKRESDNLNEKLEANKVEIGRYKRESEEKASLFSNLESEVKLKSAEIGNLKVAHLKTEAERDSLISKMECDAKLKTAEIHNLKVTHRKTEGELKSRIAKLEGELKLKSAENLKMSGDVRSGLEKVGENLSSLLNRTTEMTIRARFVVSKLTEEKTYSKWTEFAGMNWRIYLYKNDDHLAFFLQRLDANYEPCSAFLEWKLISQKSEEIAHGMNPNGIYVFDEKAPNWGYSKFIPFKDLFDEEKGYVKNDSIIVAVEFKAFPAY